MSQDHITDLLALADWCGERIGELTPRIRETERTRPGIPIITELVERSVMAGLGIEARGIRIKRHGSAQAAIGLLSEWERKLRQLADEKKQRPSPSPPKRPSDDAFRAWLTRDVLGVATQQRIAEEMTRHDRPVSQATVSRWLKAVDEYRKEGGIMPTVEELNPPRATDPAILELGARRDGLTPRQRPRRDPDADSADE